MKKNNKKNRNKKKKNKKIRNKTNMREIFIRSVKSKDVNTSDMWLTRGDRKMAPDPRWYQCVNGAEVFNPDGKYYPSMESIASASLVYLPNDAVWGFWNELADNGVKAGLYKGWYDYLELLEFVKWVTQRAAKQWGSNGDTESECADRECIISRVMNQVVGPPSPFDWSNVAIPSEYVRERIRVFDLLANTQPVEC
tara:strand:+ start:71 stop:658 length:588 start_codon:yes stop_codon:yes gene_type:complete